MKKYLLTRLKFNLIFISIISCTTPSTQNQSTRLYDTKYQDQISERSAKTKKIMISTQGVASSQAGLKIFRQGGNIVDVAAAVTFAISVERPQSTGIGGGGFLLGKLDSDPKVFALDFRETAPKKTYPSYFTSKNRSSTTGIDAAATPGVVDGIFRLMKKHGKLGKTPEGIQKIMQPAIDLAEFGFQIYPHLEKSIDSKSKKLKEAGLLQGSDFAAIFLDEKMHPKKVGTLLVQKDLAKSLRLIAKQGPRVFYEGQIAKAISATSKKNAGALSMSDLKNYRSVWRKPVQGHYKGFEVFSMPLPSSGGVLLIEMLNVLKKLELDGSSPFKTENVHKTAFAMQAAFEDRALYLGDISKLPVNGMTSKKYAAEIAKKYSPDSNQRSQPKNPNKHDPFSFESNDTTHFTIMDEQGNTITSTQTINGLFGSGIVAKDTGIVLNNEMDDFTTNLNKPNMFGLLGNKANEVRYGKRPLSSMTPTIISKNKKTVLALGSPSGPRIISCVLLTTLNYIEYNLPLFESVAASRYHHQWLPDEIRMDPDFPEKTRAQLEKLGYKTNPKKLGCSVQAIALENSVLHGVSDPRGEGKSTGL